MANATKDLDQQDADENDQGRSNVISIYTDFTNARSQRDHILEEGEEQALTDDPEWQQRYGEADELVAEKESAWQDSLKDLSLEDLDELKAAIDQRRVELEESLGQDDSESFGTVPQVGATASVEQDTTAETAMLQETQAEQDRLDEEQRNEEARAEEDRLAEEQGAAIPEAEEGMEIEHQDLQSWRNQRRSGQEEEQGQDGAEGQSSRMGHGPGGFAWGAAETMEDREEFRNLERVQGDLAHELGERANHDQVVAREQEEAEAATAQKTEEAGVAVPTLEDWRGQRTQTSEQSEAQEAVQDVQATDQQEGEAQAVEHGVSMPNLEAWRKQRTQSEGAQEGDNDTPPEQRLSSTFAQRQAQAQAEAENRQENQAAEAQENTQGQGRRNDFGQGM